MYPLRITEHRNRSNRVNLLLLDPHYCLIRTQSCVLASMTNHEHASVYCNYNLHQCSNNTSVNAAQRRQNERAINCSLHSAQKLTLPENKWMSLNDYILCRRVLYTVYVDFESFIVPKTGKNVAHHVLVSAI